MELLTPWDGSRVGLDQDEMRRHNRGAFLRLVHLSGEISRAELARRMNLNRSTIKTLTAELSAAGLSGKCRRRTIVTRAARRSRSLRPETSVSTYWRSTSRWTGWSPPGSGSAVSSLTARSLPGAGPASISTTWSRRSRQLGRQLTEAAPSTSTCVGLGASYCGMIRPDDGTVRFGPDLGWVDQAFGAELARRLRLGLRVPVGNEAHLGALAEHLRGAGMGVQNLVYLHGDVGVGGGILVGGDGAGRRRGYGCELGTCWSTRTTGDLCWLRFQRLPGSGSRRTGVVGRRGAARRSLRPWRRARGGRRRGRGRRRTPSRARLRRRLAGHRRREPDQPLQPGRGHLRRNVAGCLRRCIAAGTQSRRTQCAAGCEGRSAPEVCRLSGTTPP